MRRDEDRAEFAEFARLLKAYRRKKRWTQADVEEDMGVARGSLRRWERGAHVPSAVHFIAWVNALGLSVGVTDAESEGGR